MKKYLSAMTFAIILLLACSATAAFAQEEGAFNIHTEGVVAIPGRVLAPGDYTLRLVESTTGANFVKVTSSDEKTLYGLVSIYPTSRSETTERSGVKTVADVSGVSRVDSWYFPGSRDGFQFIYTKSDLQKIDMIAQSMSVGGSKNGD